MLHETGSVEMGKVKSSVAIARLVTWVEWKMVLESGSWGLGVWYRWGFLDILVQLLQQVNVSLLCGSRASGFLGPTQLRACLIAGK